MCQASLVVKYIFQKTNETYTPYPIYESPANKQRYFS